MPRQMNPIWEQHTVLLGIPLAGSGGREWRCRYCQGTFASTITRVIRHVSGRGGKGIAPCRAVPAEVAEAVIRENPREFGAFSGVAPAVDWDEDILEPAGTSTAHARSRKRPVPDVGSGTAPASSSASHPGGSSTSVPTATRSQPTLSSASFQKERQRLAEIEIGRTVIECNMSFNILRTEQWHRMIRAVAACGASSTWTGPSYHRMRTGFLDEEISRISSSLLPIREGWQRFGCSILSDGWTDVRRRSIINILVSSCLGTYFLRAVDASTGGQSITAEFIFQHISQAIQEVGVQNVVQVITDNGSSCRRMGEMVEEAFPTIVWTPCAAHCIDLLLQDIGSIGWISDVIESARMIVRFFRRKGKALSIFRSHSPLELIRPSETRFAYMYLVLSRLREVRDPLRQSVVDTQWVSWSEASVPHTMAVQRKVLEEAFWAHVDSLVVTLRPLYSLIRLVDMEGSTMGLFYHMWLRMRQQVIDTDAISDERKEHIVSLIDERWVYVRRPIHGMAALLHPLYRGRGVDREPWIQECRQLYCLQLYDDEALLHFHSQLGLYVTNSGASFSRGASRNPEHCRKPLTWWDMYGWSAPLVQSLACRLLSQDCSSGACERNWSSYSLIHTKVRNRLSTSQLERLVYCRANLRMLRELRSSTAGPRQVDPDTLDVEREEPQDEEARLRAEQEAIFSQLHRELEETDTRVTRSRTRLRALADAAAAAGPSSSRAPSGRPRSRAKMGARRGKGRRPVQQVPEDSEETCDIHLREPDTIPPDTFAQTDTLEEDVDSFLARSLDLDYDTEGNLISYGSPRSSESDY